MNERYDWIVRIYDSFGNQKTQFVIKDTYLRDAEEKALNSMSVRVSHDWSIRKLKPSEKTEMESVEISFSGTLTVSKKFLETSKVGDLILIDDLGEVIQNADTVEAEAVIRCNETESRAIYNNLIH